MKTETTFTATIHVGLKIRSTGEVQPIEKAKALCQTFVDEVGECVSFTPTEYIYTNGREPGVMVGFIQYPRFPRMEEEILNRALRLAEYLMISLTQYRVTVICADKTYMLENNSIKLPDAA